MSTIRLHGGRLHDPTNGVDGDVRDLVVRDGRIDRLAPGEPADESIDISGCVAMAGGIDLHTHIGGGKVNLYVFSPPALTTSSSR
jgi:formylmethanofuran dehydrogenase subunit A